MKLFNILVLISILTFFKSSYAQRDLEITIKRPRVLISSDKIQELKQLLNDNKTERIDTLFSSIKEGTAGFESLLKNKNLNIDLLKDTLEQNWSWSFENPERSSHALKLIILHHKLNINKDIQERRILFIAKELERELEIFLTNDFTECSLLSRERYLKDFRLFSRFSPYLIDWAYEVFDPTESDLRNSLIQKLWQVNLQFMRYNVLNIDFPECTDFYYAGGHSLQNNMLNLKLIVALYNTPELDNEQQKALEDWKNTILYNLEIEFLPIHKFYIDDNEDGLYGDFEGGTHWGASYSKYAREVWAELFDIIYYASGINYYEENPWFNSVINQDFFYLKPDLTTLHLGDGTQPWQFENDYSIISLFNNYNHPKNIWAMRQFEIGANNRFTSKLNELLFRDWDKKTYSIKKLNIKDWFSRKTGALIYKSSLNKDATMVTYFSPVTFRNNHQQMDANGFQIYKKGPLFIDSGVYDSYKSSHYLNYYSRTVAHNTITIQNSNGLFGSKLSKDGGQEISDILLNYSQILNNYNPEIWKKNIINDKFNYSVTDAVSTFNTSRVKTCIRKFYFEKQSEKIIILDFVQKRKNNITKFNAHFLKKPTIKDVANNKVQEEVIVPNHIFKYSANQNKVIIENDGGGKAVLKALYPYDTQILIVGGKGYEYYVFKGKSEQRGENYEPIGKINRTEGALWRLEIKRTKKESQKEEMFINTIALGESNKLIDNTSRIFSEIDNSIGIVWDKEIYVFSNKHEGDINQGHILNLQNIESDRYHFSFFDLAIESTYEIYFDDSLQKSISTDAEGYLKIEDLLIPKQVNELRVVKKS